MNQELEQYLWFSIYHRQKDWPEWLTSVEFVVNNKIYSAIKVFLFMVNYGRELRMKADIRRKEKVEKTIEFAERMKKEAGAVLRKAQKEMRWQADKGKKTKEWKKKDKMMLNMKDLVFKEQLANKFVD